MSTPSVPRPAATVLLLRDHPHPPAGYASLQVFLQRRVAGMAFAGGMTVFPGGGVDAADHAAGTDWVGPQPQWWGRRLGCPDELAAALVHAAVRETFEECGVLLAGPEVPDGLDSHRADLVARRRTLNEALAEHGLVLRADLLRPWARWITPPRAGRRYDTAFFVAQVPAGQDADAHTTEAVEATWWHPEAALQGWRDGALQLMPPTFACLREIAAYPDSAAVLAAADRREIRPIMPDVRQQGGEVRVVVGDGADPLPAGLHVPPDHR